MKLTWFLVLFFTLQMSASVWSQTMSVKLKNSTLQELFLQIEKSSNYRFFYNNDEVDVNQRISVDAERKTVADILTTAFEGLPYSFKERENKLILIERTGVPSNKIATPNSQQQKSVSGKVTDSSGSSIPGVSVVVKGTTNGRITDTNGNYSLSNVPENATLQFSFVGMKGQEIAVGGKTTLNVTMEEDAIGIDEVVVTSFGIKKTLKQLTYATQEVKGDQLASVGNPNVLGGLQGKVAGVSVTLNSGMPGKAPDIKIRGSRSLTGSNAPLYVIDGMPVAGGDRAADFNPNDIESINIISWTSQNQRGKNRNFIAWNY